MSEAPLWDLRVCPEPAETLPTDTFGPLPSREGTTRFQTSSLVRWPRPRPKSGRGWRSELQIAQMWRSLYVDAVDSFVADSG